MIACHKRLKMLVFSQHTGALVAVQTIKNIYFITILTFKISKAQHNRLSNKKQN